VTEAGFDLAGEGFFQEEEEKAHQDEVLEGSRALGKAGRQGKILKVY
jgi:hypothetical protein